MKTQREILDEMALAEMAQGTYDRVTLPEDSEEATWQNAAESLPAQPEQWIELTSDALRFGNKPPVIRCFDCKSEGGFHKANCRDTSRYEVPVEAKEKCPEICRKCNHPHYNMEDSEFCRSMNDEEETNCPKREEGIHCNCWYDGNPCCACGDVKTEPIAEPKPTPFTPTEPSEEQKQEWYKRGFTDAQAMLKPQPDSGSISTDQTFEDVLRNRAGEYQDMGREHRKNEEYAAACCCEDKASGLYVAIKLYRSWAAAKGAETR